MAKFLVDAQLPPALARKLREHGLNATHVNDIGLGAAADGQIAKQAEKTGALLITADSDANRRPFRFEIADHSDLKSPAIPI